MGKAVLVHQADVERDLAEFLDVEATVLEVFADLQNVLFAHVERDVHRIELHDRRQLGGDAVADQFADGDEMLGDDAVERRQHRRVAEVGLGDGEIAFVALDIGARAVALGLGGVVGRL